MLLQSNPFSFFHKQGAKALVLELCWVPGGHRNHAAIHMELPDNGTAALELRPVALLRQLPEPEEPDEDVLLRVLIA